MSDEGGEELSDAVDPLIFERRSEPYLTGSAKKRPGGPVRQRVEEVVERQQERRE